MRTTTTKYEQQATLARAMAAEDLCLGDYVALLSVVREYPSFMWDCPSELLLAHEPVRITCRPCEKLHLFRILDICLPFLFVKAPGGDHRTLDVRRCQLARLDDRYGAHVWRTLRKAAKKKSKRKG